MSKTELPRVSIMIPTYNQQTSIGKAVESALVQDYQNLEVIVSDDCSTDETKAAVEVYRSNEKLIYYRNDINLGRIGNYRKVLFERITGDFAINLDGDDYLYADDVISRMVSAMMNHPDRRVVAVMGSTLTLNRLIGTSTESPENSIPGLFEGVDIFLSWDKRNFHHLAVLYQAALARSLDYYRLDTIRSDADSALRLVLNGAVVVVADIIGVWNIHGNNTSGSNSVKDAIDDYSYIEESYKYATTRGLDTALLERWRKRMVNFHTRTVMRSNVPLRHKLSVFIPHVLTAYPFALAELCSPKSWAASIARVHPAIYRKAKVLYSKFK